MMPSSLKEETDIQNMNEDLKNIWFKTVSIKAAEAFFCPFGSDNIYIS